MTRALLTRSQAETVRLVAEGWTNAKIGHELKRSEDAIKSRVHHAMRRVGARDRAHLVHIAHLIGLLPAGCTCRDRIPAESPRTTIQEGRPA